MLDPIARRHVCGSDPFGVRPIGTKRRARRSTVCGGYQLGRRPRRHRSRRCERAAVGRVERLREAAVPGTSGVSPRSWWQSGCATRLPATAAL